MDIPTQITSPFLEEFRPVVPLACYLICIKP